MGLLLSKHEKFVDRHALALVPTPEATRTWRPVSHIHVVDAVHLAIDRHGWRIRDEQYGLARDRQKMFGVICLEHSGNVDWTRTIGIRNSHDKSLSVGITAGVNVLVCSNLAFGGTSTLQRRHTSGIDLNSLVDDVVHCLEDSYLDLECSLDRLRDVHLNLDQARAILVQAAEINAIPSCDILPIFREFQEPRHEDFNVPSCWTLLNACTELSHKYSPARADLCHRRLTRLFGLDAQEPVLEILR
jgi:hypothetical protein